MGIIGAMPVVCSGVYRCGDEGLNANEGVSAGGAGQGVCRVVVHRAISVSVRGARCIWRDGHTTPRNPLS